MILVDHRRRALPAPRCLLHSPPLTQIGHRLAPTSRDSQGDVGTISRSVYRAGPQGLTRHSRPSRLPGRIAAATTARPPMRIARHHDVARPSSGQPTTVIACRRLGRLTHLGAEMAQHAFGVIARGLGFDHRGLAAY
jgi:hypothetical protein